MDELPNFPPPLERDEERELVIKAQAGDVEAISKVVMHNMRFVVQIIHSRRKLRLQREDMIQEGAIILTRALATFNAAAGVRFVTYAGTLLLPQLNDAASKNRGVIHQPSVWNLAKATEHCRQQSAATESVLSINDTLGRDDTRQLVSRLVDHHAPDATAIDEADEFQSQLKAIAGSMAALSRRQRQVLALRMQGFTLDETGGILSVSRERVRQIESAAIAKLAAAVECGDYPPGELDDLYCIPEAAT